MSDALLDELRTIVGAAHVLVDPDVRATYEVDWTGRFRGVAFAVVRPASTAEVAAVLRACHAAGVAVVPQGGNSGLVGGAVPCAGDVLLSLQRLTTIEPIDVAAAQATVGAGVTLAAVTAAAHEQGLDFGVDLAARESATVGGMIATNAGGARAFRYGSMREQVVGIELALADGRVIERLQGLTKDNTGYALAPLVAGSEGTLGVVTRARVRLLAARPHRVVALLTFASMHALVDALAILRTRVATLEAAEFMTHGCFALGDAPLAAVPSAALLVECAGRSFPPLDDLATGVVALGDLVVEEVVALDPGPQAVLWDLRESLGARIRAVGDPYKNDVAVPLSRLAAFVDAHPAVVARIAPDATVFLFGHAGDGNVHVNVVGLDDGTEPAVTDAVLGCTLEHLGTIGAEHGIGRAKAAWLARARPAEELALFADLKRAFDPSGTLNPGVLVAGGSRS
jgi:FAD/FMN-containing dehydrogenase